MHKLILILSLLLFFSCTKQKPIRVAYMATLSGKNSELGIGGRTGIRLAVDEWNARGGINGRPIELVIFNDKGKVDEGIALIDSLKAQNISLVLGPLTSNLKPVVEAGMKENILFVSPTMSSSSLSIKDDLFVRFIDPASYQSKLLCNDIKERNIKSLLVLLDERNLEYTGDIYKHLKKYLREEGVEIDPQLENLKLGSPERFAELTQLITETKPEAVLIVSSGIDFGITAQHLRKSPHQFELLGARWASTKDMIAHGGKAVEGTHIVGNIPRKTPTSKEQKFIDTYKSIHNMEPSFIPIFAYDAANGLFTVLTKSKSTDPLKVRDTFISIGEFTGLQGSITIDSLGDTHRDVIQMLTVENGQMVPWQKRD